MIDLFDNIEKEKKCLDKGFIRIVDCMPRIVPDGQTADYRIVQAARVSYADGTKSINEDRGLVRYLLRHNHTSPLEKVRFEFHVKLPLFVRSQWQRHRTGSFNELSFRYSIPKDEYYFPEKNNVRLQSNKNKQVSEGSVSEELAERFIKELKDDAKVLHEVYSSRINEGIGREQARIGLQQNLYTEFYWTIDLHNLLHFLALRCHKHAQQEIQVYANSILDIIKNIVPITIEAWEDYHPMRSAILFSRLEIEALKNLIEHISDKKSFALTNISSDNKGENQEWVDKIKGLLQ